MASAIRDIALHTVVTDKVKFNNNRYQHREVAARLLFLEHMQVNSGKLADTKKPYLDKMVMDYRDANLDPSPIIKGTTVVLDEMANVFTDRDELLRSQASMTVYYLLFRAAIELNNVSHITRRKLLDFRSDKHTSDLQSLMPTSY